MRITESQLRRIIRQEIRNSMLSEGDLDEANVGNALKRLAGLGIAGALSMGSGAGEAEAKPTRKAPVQSMTQSGQEKLRAFDEFDLKHFAEIAAENASAKGKMPEAEALQGIAQSGFKSRFFTDRNYKVSGLSVADEWMRAYRGEM